MRRDNRKKRVDINIILWYKQKILSIGDLLLCAGLLSPPGPNGLCAYEKPCSIVYEKLGINRCIVDIAECRYGELGVVDAKSFERMLTMNIHEDGSNDIFVTPDRKKHSLLIVDSDAQNLLYISMLLQRFDYQTDTAKTAREAFASATLTIPSLIITALGLKDMNGLNLIKLLRKNPKTTNIPFIALRNQEDAVGEQYCFSAGAVDCLVKPVSAELLYRAVQGGLEDKPRATMRIRTIQPVKVGTIPFDGREGMYTLDLSERGIFLRTSKSAPENTLLSCRINLSGTIIAAEAKVIYTCPPCKGPYHEPGMGLQFTYVSQNDLELLRNFIRTEVTRGIVPEQDLPYSPTNHASL
jgi:CheY-like chemotaxis protein